jgi:hypothetical protein
LGVLHIKLFFLQKSEPSDDNVKAKYILVQDSPST